MKYTVILIRPDEVTKAYDVVDVKRGEADSFVALVAGADCAEAVKKARKFIQKADRRFLKDLDPPVKTKAHTYKVAAIYEGHKMPDVLAYQISVWSES